MGTLNVVLVLLGFGLCYQLGRNIGYCAGLLAGARMGGENTVRLMVDILRVGGVDKVTFHQWAQEYERLTHRKA